MCRSIKRLRTENGPAPDDEVREAALQFVRKVSGFRHPSPANADACNRAVDEIAASSATLLRRLPNKKETPQREASSIKSSPSLAGKGMGVRSRPRRPRPTRT
jgi:hypothetical protein